MKTLVIAAATLAIAAAGTNATDLTWVGGTGDWTAAGNWSPAQVPTAADNAWLTNSGSYTVTIPAGSSATAGALILGGANGPQILDIDQATLTLISTSSVNTNGQISFLAAQSVLTGPGDLLVDGAITWSNGTISGTGALNINNHGVLAIGSGGVTLGRTLNNSGAGSWSGGILSISDGSSFNNLPGGTFDITADGSLNGSALTPINNSGVVRLTAGNTGTTVTAPFNNTGNLQVLVTTLNLNLGGTHGGTFTTAPGAALNLGGGSHVLNSGSLVTGTGPLSISGGASVSANGVFDVGTTVNVTGGLLALSAGCNVTGAALDVSGAGAVLDYTSDGPVAALNIGAGILGGTAPVTITGLFGLAGGTVTNALILAQGGIAISGDTTLDGVKLVNPGTAIWSAGTLTGANGAAISNLLGAIFINTFDGNAASSAGATPLFINEGSFQKTNGTAALGTTSIDFQFVNTGTVEVRTNTLRYGANSQTAGLTLLDGGSLSAQDQPIQLLGGTLTGTGAVAVADTMALVNSAVVSPGSPVGELDITGNYQQTGSGALNIVLGGYIAGTDYALMTVSAGAAGGVATLDGTLNVTLTNGFSPTNGAVFTFLSALSRVGSFAAFNYPSNEIGMQVSYDTNSARLTVSNLKPIVANPIVAPAPTSYGSAFGFQFPTNTFVDPDGDALTYSASGMPAGVIFTAASQTFSGTPTSTGTFPIAVVATDNGVPSLSVTNLFTVLIDPAVLTVAANPQSKSYGATDPLLTFSVSGLQLADTASTLLSGSLSRAVGETVAGGPYAITRGTLAASANYTVNFSPSTLVIAPAALTVSALPKSKTYGAPDPALSFTANGLQFNDTQGSVLGGAPSRVPGELVAGSPYAITQGTLATTDSNYFISFTSSSLTIAPATLGVTAQPQTKIYGASDPALSFTASGLQFSDTQASVLTGALNRTSGESVSGGPYPINQGTLASTSGNYTISFTASSLSVTPATLSVSAQSKTKIYGASDPALSFTASGFKFSETQASALTGALSRISGESVAGSPYAISQGNLAAVNGNYTINFTASNLRITPSALSVAAQPKTKIYGAPDPALSFTASGFKFSETQASALTGALSRTSGESVAGGPYAISQGNLAAVNGNYTINFTGSSLSITPATLRVTAQPQTKVYGAPDPTLSFTASGLQFSDTQGSALTGALSRTSGESVAGGPYPISQGNLAAANNSNYTISFSASSLSITPATLGVTAQPQTKVYGAPDPTLSFTASGLQFSDTQASTLSGGLSRAAGETVAGSPYAITQGSLTSANANYVISFTPGFLRIALAPLSVAADSETKIEGAPDPAFTVAYTGFVNSETSAVLDGALVVARAPGEAPGLYPVTPSGLTGSNYVIFFIPGTLTIVAPTLQPAMGITKSNGTQILLTWDAVSNVTYRVQYSSALGGANWTDLPGDVLASSITASKADVPTPTNRFYRVRVLP